MIKYLDKLKQLKKNNKGVMAIEIVVGVFIFLIVLSFLMDLTVLTWKFSVISQTNSYLARTVGIQGGAYSSAPHGFPGGDSAYASSSEIANKIKTNFNNSGIKDGEYTVSINGRNLGSNVKVDYQDIATTEITLIYKWQMISNFIPGTFTNTLKSKRAVMSEFKYRYDSWIGE